MVTEDWHWSKGTARSMEPRHHSGIAFRREILYLSGLLGGQGFSHGVQQHHTKLKRWRKAAIPLLIRRLTMSPFTTRMLVLPLYKPLKSQIIDHSGCFYFSWCVYTNHDVTKYTMTSSTHNGIGIYNELCQWDTGVIPGGRVQVHSPHLQNSH